MTERDRKAQKQCILMVNKMYTVLSKVFKNEIKDPSINSKWCEFHTTPDMPVR